MGARVIALGRNIEALKLLAETHTRIETVAITGDVNTDTVAIKSFGPVNAFLDISPAEAAESTHFLSSILALTHGGRACFMGGLGGKDLKIPIRIMISRDLVLRGKWMYSRQDVRDLIQMVEVGVLKLDLQGERCQKFGLDEWQKGFEAAGVKGATCVMVP
jgi:threonine dehydrogenase-like Zn-dependent dehydrogenase